MKTLIALAIVVNVLAAVEVYRVIATYQDEERRILWSLQTVELGWLGEYRNLRTCRADNRRLINQVYGIK